MRLRLALLVATFTGLPAGSWAQIDNVAPYHALLAKSCGPKHLEWLSPADLNDLIMIDFEGGLAKGEKNRLARANNEKIACANTIAGATCENVSHLKAMRKTGLLEKFAKSVCESGFICRGQSDCKKIQAN